MAEVELRAEEVSGDWRLVGALATRFGLINDFLAYLGDRRYSPRTIRAYAFDLLHFARWLAFEGLGLEAVTTDGVLR
ncbi:MAG: site-specific integrase, partial [Chloroflexi bacterium]|nr:site-specific integrase [Chloroflexota bacterium]